MFLRNFIKNKKEMLHSMKKKKLQHLGVLPVKNTIKNNKFLYRQSSYYWRYFYVTFIY